MLPRREMPAKAETQAALNGMNQKDVKGRALNVNAARLNTERSGDGDGRGRGAVWATVVVVAEVIAAEVAGAAGSH